MKSYITKPKSIRRSEIIEKEFSLSSADQRIIKINSNSKILKNLLLDVFKGEDMEESDFLNFPTNYKYLKTASLTSDNFILDESSSNCFEYISKNSYEKFSNNCRKINKYDIIYTSTGSNNKIGDCALSSKDLTHNFSSHIFKINPKEEINKFYLFSILKSSYCKEACDLEVPKAGIMRRGGKRFLNLKIPFPTTTNHQEPEKIEKLVSIITQNIIDKEEKINEKNKKIDELIEKELGENQKSENNFKYSYPKISEIKKESRLDTGIYKKEFKEIDFLIRNYEGGFDFIDENNIKGGNTPKKRIFDIGNLWLTPTDCKRGILKNKNLIKSESYNLDQDSLVIVNRSNVGETFLFKTEYFNIAHHNQGMYRVKINKDKYAYYVFILCFFNSFIFQQYINNLSTGSTFKEIRSDELSKKAPIPNFPESKQQKIAKEYYNKIDNNQNLTLDNYLELEKARNDQLGIFQLNMEIFSLREKLEDIIDKIINDKKIDINLNY
jgi:hypothetical protein